MQLVVRVEQLQHVPGREHMPLSGEREHTLLVVGVEHIHLALGYCKYNIPVAPVGVGNLLVVGNIQAVGGSEVVVLP